VRRVPHLGDAVAISYLAVEVLGVVAHVERGGRQLTVRTADGEDLVFVLNPAIGHFTENGELTGPRLRVIADDG
jgi:hypothetical protein